MSRAISIPGITQSVLDAAIAAALATTTPQTFVWKGLGAPATTSARYAAQGFSAPTATVDAVLPQIVAASCTAYALIFSNSHTPLATDTVTVTLQRAPSGSSVFVDTALTFVIPAGTTAWTSVGDSAHTVALTQGDNLAIKLVQSGSTAQADWYSMFTLACR